MNNLSFNRLYISTEYGKDLVLFCNLSHCTKVKVTKELESQDSHDYLSFFKYVAWQVFASRMAFKYQV